MVIEGGGGVAASVCVWFDSINVSVLVIKKQCAGRLGEIRTNGHYGSHKYFSDN